MKEFARLIERFERWTGLDLRRGSSSVALERYLQMRLPADDPTALARYVEELTTPHHPEAVRLVDAITVCHSSFYRDSEQLACVEAVLRADTSRPARVWVPACATGEEPYSVALIAERAGRPVSILATDINTRALAHALAGIYGPWSVRDLPASMALPQRPDGRYEVPERLRRHISFTRHNLMDVVPGSADGWDVIMCRNVLMYLSRDRVRDVLQRLAAALRPGGYLFVGANDVFERPPPLLRFVRIGQRHALWRPPGEASESSIAPTPPAGIPVMPGAPVPPVTAPLAPTPPMATPTVPAPTVPAPPVTAQLVPAPPVTAPLVPAPPASAPAPPAPPAPRAATSLPTGHAHALLLQGDTTAALELVLAVLDADPLCVEARLIAGIAYQLMGDAHQATAALRAALVLAPDLWPAEMYFGFALLQLGDDASANRALRRGAELAATNERLPLSPAVATWFEGWRGDAIAMARHTRRASPD